MSRDAYIDRQGVTLFTGAMLEKMNVARRKGRSGWDDTTQCSTEDLNRMLHEHLAKGDPVDVANFCMMLWNRGEKIAAASAYLAAPRKPVAWMHSKRANADVITDSVKRFLAPASPYKVENYTIPLYAAPVAAPEWVAVEDGLPAVPEGEDVNVWTLDGPFVQRDRFIWQAEGGVFARSPNTTHWRYAEPTPQPPNTKEKAK